MEKKIIRIGILKGTHGGRRVYYPYSGGGICPTLASTDFKHNKMIVVCRKG